jgi:hypothetical protein
MEGACPDSIAQSGTKVQAHWRHAVHILHNTLPASTAGRDLAELTLSFLKVEHKYAIKWSTKVFSDDRPYYKPLKRCAECCFLWDPKPARPTRSRSRSQIVCIEHPTTVNISIKRNSVTKAEKSQQIAYHIV